ncbi:hypothetical protein N9043_01905, partial [bacterium]|nr:hypothetical protein [bacterium]
SLHSEFRLIDSNVHVTVGMELLYSEVSFLVSKLKSSIEGIEISYLPSKGFTYDIVKSSNFEQGKAIREIWKSL